MVEDSQRLESGFILHETYELEALLGTGGMGAVWRAQHLRLPRKVAVKVLHEDGYRQEDTLRRFIREAEITSRLRHPHIVEVVDFNVLPDGRAYLVMELLDGVSLREHLIPGCPLPPGWVVTVAEQIGSALAHAHAEGVVHRDLKPENIFAVAATGEVPHVKVLDFGISKMQGAQTELTLGGSLMGTPRYMSPEQARGDSSIVDGRADQFSMGAMIYEMFAGRPAFEGTSVTSVLIKVLQEDPLPLKHHTTELPESVGGTVMRALSKSREDRFPNTLQFCREPSSPMGRSAASNSLAATYQSTG